jgi:hypothetical protein
MPTLKYRLEARVEVILLKVTHCGKNTGRARGLRAGKRGDRKLKEAVYEEGKLKEPASRGGVGP